MVRTGGMTCTCNPTAKAGSRISDMRFGSQLMEAGKTYKVAGWAPVQEASKNAGPPAWEVLETYLKDKKTIAPIKLYNQKLLGLDGNPGVVI